jgi:plasmid maintenance system antidote protein VapI
MDASIHPLAQDWAVLLDELKQKEGITSDSKLAEVLGVTRGYICSIRKGRKGLSFNLAQKVFSRLGRTFDTTNLERLFVPIRVQLRTKNLAAVKNYVIQRAKGHCQLCRCAAPFNDGEGRPYLEVRHILPFCDGDPTPDNLVALCPNCYTKVEVRADATDKKKLQAIVAKYKGSPNT